MHLLHFWCILCWHSSVQIVLPGILQSTGIRTASFRNTVMPSPPLPATLLEGLRSDISSSLFCRGSVQQLKEGQAGDKQRRRLFFHGWFIRLCFLQWRAVPGCSGHDSWGWAAVSTVMVLSLQRGSSGNHSDFF